MQYKRLGRNSILDPVGLRLHRGTLYTIAFPNVGSVRRPAEIAKISSPLVDVDMHVNEAGVTIAPLISIAHWGASFHAALPMAMMRPSRIATSAIPSRMVCRIDDAAAPQQQVYVPSCEITPRALTIASHDPRCNRPQFFGAHGTAIRSMNAMP
jgi:hypothetical protein